MKRFSLFLFFSFCVFLGSFALRRLYDHPSLLLDPFSRRIENPVSSPPSLSPLLRPALKNRPFVFVVVAFNNGATVEKTLRSIFSQNYENYRLIYIDDGSDNGSFDLARDLIYESDHLTQATLVRNEETLGHLANLYRAVQSCQDDEIVIVVPGEDWLAHEWVLQQLNGYYADPDLWMVLGRTIDFPTYRGEPFKKIEKTNFRLQKGGDIHLQTFYAGLFKKIEQSDLVCGGRFLPGFGELAYMIPMMEMGGEHCESIPEVLSIHNREAAYTEDAESRSQCESFVRSLSPYPPLTAFQEIRCSD